MYAATATCVSAGRDLLMDVRRLLSPTSHEGHSKTLLGSLCLKTYWLRSILKRLLWARSGGFTKLFLLAILRIANPIMTARISFFATFQQRRDYYNSHIPGSLPSDYGEG
jgi:hypothetical protein